MNLAIIEQKCIHLTKKTDGVLAHANSRPQSDAYAKGIATPPKQPHITSILSARYVKLSPMGRFALNPRRIAMSPMMQRAIAEIHELNEAQITRVLQLIADMKAEPMSDPETNRNETLNSEEIDESDRLFYSESNIKFILEGVKAANEGKLTPHELIEVD